MPFWTPRLSLSGTGELRLRLVPVDKMLFCNTETERCDDTGWGGRGGARRGITYHLIIKYSFSRC